MQSAVLFLVFNRPDTTGRVFEAIRQAKPPRLYVAADGPRAGRDGEAALCAETRRVAAAVDWDCEVRTLFRDENRGCKMAVSEAITWFFTHEERGIILEDDCLPVPDFFRFCDEMLERYQSDPRVMMVSGDNFTQDSGLPLEGSYYFSAFGHIWGWASWRRAWSGYDVTMSQWSEPHGKHLLRQVFPGNAPIRRIWMETFGNVAAGRINTWDYQWNHHCWVQGGLSCVPERNLISNIGFDDRATHTTQADSPLADMPVGSLTWPLRHPEAVARNWKADAWEAARFFNLARYSWRRVLGRKLKVFLGLRQAA